MALLGLLVLADPALANKFETISSGMTGSIKVKREFVQTALLVGGGIFWLSAVLAIVVPHSNPSFLNYANWKASAAVLAVLGSVMLIGYLFV